VNRPGADRIAVVRAAKPGDVIVMLAMDSNDLPSDLENHLMELQQVVSGYPSDMPHITLQRFGSATRSSGMKLLDHLSKYKSTLQPIDIIADGFLPVYSDFQKLYLLKWTVPGNIALRKWYELVDKTGRMIGLQPIYLRQGFGAWVTALLDIDPSGSERLNQIKLPKPLFCVNRLVISRLLGPGDYELVGEFLF
jgi:2'-5' RNA ligase